MRYRGLALGVLILLGVVGLTGRWWWREYRWRLIVIHHTASDHGNLAYIRKLHMTERGWSDIAYHFVVNNGSMNTTPGQVEVSDLWRNRLANFSTRIAYANQFGIAVALVGNFQNHPMPELQKQALVRLLANLAKAHRIPTERIVRHKDLQTTACPGRHVDLREIRLGVQELLQKEK